MTAVNNCAGQPTAVIGRPSARSMRASQLSVGTVDSDSRRSGHPRYELGGVKLLARTSRRKSSGREKKEFSTRTPPITATG